MWCGLKIQLFSYHTLGWVPNFYFSNLSLSSLFFLFYSWSFLLTKTNYCSFLLDSYFTYCGDFTIYANLGWFENCCYPPFTSGTHDDTLKVAGVCSATLSTGLLPIQALVFGASSDSLFLFSYIYSSFSCCAVFYKGTNETFWLILELVKDGALTLTGMFN